MEFLGLKYLGFTVFAIAFLIGCTSSNLTKHQFVEYEIGNSVPKDSMVIKEIILNQGIKSLEVIGQINPNGESIEVKEDDRGIFLKNGNCPTFELVVAFGKREMMTNSCGDLYPIFGETVEWFYKKEVLVNGERYTVHMFDNGIGDSYLNSSAVFWLEKFGIILINMYGGRYYKLVDTENVNTPWKEVLELVMVDKDFTGLREIPEAPPPPPKD